MGINFLILHLILDIFNSKVRHLGWKDCPRMAVKETSVFRLHFWKSIILLASGVPEL